jgi:hypothetical protein
VLLLHKPTGKANSSLPGIAWSMSFFMTLHEIDV